MLRSLTHLCGCILLSCGQTQSVGQLWQTDEPLTANLPAPKIHYQVYKIYKRPANIFTQGIELAQPHTFVETSGLYGRSFMHIYDFEHQRVIRKISFPPYIFAEGLTQMNGKIYTLSWRENLCFVWNQRFVLERTFSLPTEGWGLTHNDSSLIVSTGSEHLYFYSPTDFHLQKKIRVYWPDTKQSLVNINELEWVDGTIFANIWGENTIAKIDPQTGSVTGLLDLSDLITTYFKDKPLPQDGVLNGIAYDTKQNILYVTGKYWPVIFALTLL